MDERHLRRFFHFTEEDLFDDDEYLYDLSLENQVGIRERWSFAPA